MLKREPTRIHYKCCKEAKTRVPHTLCMQLFITGPLIISMYHTAAIGFPGTSTEYLCDTQYFGLDIEVREM